MSWEGIGRISVAVADGRGAILALPHLGGWEWGGFWMVQQGFPMTVVVEALEPPELFEWFAGFRRSLGMEVVAVGPEAAMAVVRALRAGGVVCLLCDRNVGGQAASRWSSSASGPSCRPARRPSPCVPARRCFLGGLLRRPRRPPPGGGPPRDRGPSR